MSASSSATTASLCASNSRASLRQLRRLSGKDVDNDRSTRAELCAKSGKTTDVETFLATLSQDQVPSWAWDPIALSIIRHPYTTSAGMSYEYQTLFEHMKSAGRTAKATSESGEVVITPIRYDKFFNDPTSRRPISHVMFPNEPLRKCIDDWLRRNYGVSLPDEPWPQKTGHSVRMFESWPKNIVVTNDGVSPTVAPRYVLSRWGLPPGFVAAQAIPRVQSISKAKFVKSDVYLQLTQMLMQILPDTTSLLPGCTLEWIIAADDEPGGDEEDLYSWKDGRLILFPFSDENVHAATTWAEVKAAWTASMHLVEPYLVDRGTAVPFQVEDGNAVWMRVPKSLLNAAREG